MADFAIFRRHFGKLFLGLDYGFRINFRCARCVEYKSSRTCQGRVGQKVEVAQNVLKHILVLKKELWKRNLLGEGRQKKVVNILRIS